MLVFTEPDPQRRRPAGTAQDRRQGVHLDRVAQRRAGAVRLDVVDLLGPHAGAGRNAARMTACWAGPLGTVRPLDCGRPG